MAYAYNAVDQITSATPPQPKGSKTTYLYDNNNNVYRIEVENKDSTGTPDAANPWFTTTTNYNDNNVLVSVTSEIDASTTATRSYEYTAGSRLKKITDPTGRAVEFEYDERGFLFKRTVAPGTAVAGTTVYNYSLNGDPSEVIDARGNSTLVGHDHAGRMVSVTLPNQTKLTITYDANSNSVKTETTDAGGIVRSRMTSQYDPSDLPVSVGAHLLDAAGQTTQTNTTTYDYDSGMRLRTVTDPLSNATTIVWTGASWPSVVTDAASNKVEVTYDLNGNPTKVTRSDWNQVTSGYDVLVFDFVYDDLDRSVSATRRDLGTTISSTTATEYDGRGLVTKFTDELGNTSLNEWDGFARLLKAMRELRAGGTGGGAVTSTIEILRVYDLAGRLTSVNDGKTNATTYEYDDRGRTKKTTNASGQATSLTYDANGNVLTITQPIGTIVTNTWDVLNQLTAQSAVPATGVIGDTSVTTDYDALGRWTKIVDGDTTVERAYDSLGRVISETQGPNPLGGAGKTFSFAFNAAGMLTSVTYPDGTIENRTPDAIGRPSTVAIQGGATLATYQYSGSRVPSVVFSNGVTRTHTFDALRRTTQVEYKKTASIRKFEYIYDLANNRLLEKRHHAAGTGDNYTLDSIYRTVLVKAGVADPVAEHQTPGSQTVTSTTTPTYDKANNRTHVVVNAGGTPTTTNYVADALNFYTSVGGTTHTRDANGNLRDDGTNLYSYDYRNQLVKVTKKSDGSVVATYEYDGLGRRTSKTTSGTTRSFYWVGVQLAMEYDSQGLASRRHYGVEFGEVTGAYQRDVADLDQDGSTVDFVWLTPAYDGSFDCVAMLDANGLVVESYVHTYDGAVTITNGSGQPITTSAIGWFQGYGRMYRDSETELLYAVHRYYSPFLGRFLTEDPLGRWFDAPNGGSGYAWSANRYRNNWDPLGLAPAFGRTHGVMQRSVDQLRSGVEVLQNAIHGMRMTSTGTPEMRDLEVLLLRDEMIRFVATSDRAMDALGAENRTLGYWRRSRGRYLLYIRESTIRGNYEQFLWTVLHEMMHAGRDRHNRRCRDRTRRLNQHVGGDEDDVLEFEEDVWWMLLRLRRSDRVMFRAVDPTRLSQIAQDQDIPTTTPTRSR